MLSLIFDNKTIREKFIEILKSEFNKFTVDTKEILTLLEEDIKLEYKIDSAELQIYKQLLHEMSNLLPKTYYFIIGGRISQWFVIQDLSNFKELCRDYGNPITLIKFNKYKNEADIYLRETETSNKTVSGRDIWRAETGGID